MKEEHVDEILAALDKACKPLGAETFDQAFRATNNLIAEIVHENRALEDRGALKQKLRAAPEMSAENRRKFVEEISRGLSTFRKLALAEIKALPHAPGGRRRLDVHEQPDQICAEILDLFGKKVLLRDAYKRVGRRYGASARTIQRIWNQRQKHKAT
jgi:hypothetical protein